MDLTGNLKSMYCQDLRVLKVKDTSFEKSRYLVGQFSALLTGFSDILVQINDLSSLKKILRGNIDHYWTLWAEKKNEEFKNHINYEEPLKIKLVDRKFYFNPFLPNFGVKFDLNRGEFDATHHLLGKIKARFNLHLPHSFLSWVRRSWREAKEKEDQKEIKRILEETLFPQLKEAREKWHTTPWRGKLEKLIARELLEQLSLYEGDFFESPQKKMLQVPIHLHYGLFALKEFHSRWKVQRKFSP